MNEDNIIIDTWMCNVCQDINISDSSLRHDMNMCKCGEAGYDLEKYYSRSLGDLSILRRVIYDKDKIQIGKVIHYCISCGLDLPNHKLTCMHNEHSPKKIFLNLELDNDKWYRKLWRWLSFKKEIKQAQCKHIKREGESCTLNNKCTYPKCNKLKQ